MASNAEVSRQEVAEFMASPPADKFLYINRDQSTATTWMGELLGHVRFGHTWKDNMGARRVSVIVRAVNGHEYRGTFYESTGDYARVRHVKTCGCWYVREGQPMPGDAA